MKKPNTRLLKNNLTVLFSILMIIFWSSSVQAQEYLRVYTSKPGQMTSDVTGGTKETETFNSFPVNDYHWAPLPNGYKSSIGTYYQTHGGSFIEADNQYGAGTGNYMAVEVGGKVDLVFNHPVTYFGFAWPAGDGENTITVYRKGQVIGTFNTADVIKMLPDNKHNYITAINGSRYRTSEYYGKPGTGRFPQDAQEPFAYLHFVASSGMAFDKIEFTMGAGGNFENDSHTILTSGTPQPQGSWVQLINRETPTAVDDNASGTPSHSVSIDVLNNDKKGDADLVPSSVQISGTSSAGASLNVAGQGIWSVNKRTGAITFTPDPSLVGSPSPIQYFVRDENGFASNLATVSVTYPVAPTAKNDSTTATPGQKVTIHVLNNDVPGSISLDPSTVQIVGTKNPGQPLNIPHQGIWSVDKKTGDISFNPDNNLVGSPDPIQYTVTDKNGIASNKATVKITYLTGPTAVNDNTTGLGGHPITVNVLQNDKKGSSDIVPSTVQITGTSHAGDPLNIPGQGVWSVNKNNGDITFTPASGFTTSPAPIKYSVKDKNGIVSNEAIVKIICQTGPTAMNDSTSGTPGNAVTVKVLNNDTKGTSDIVPATVQIVGTPNPGNSLTVSGQGVWSINKNNGDITFTPANGFTTSPTPIQYSVKDKNGIVSNKATVKITYLTGPTAIDDNASGLSGHPTTVNVLQNDKKGSSDIVPSTVQITGTSHAGDPLNIPGQGVWSVNKNNGDITFTPASGFTTSPAPIKYSVKDKNGIASNEAIIRITYQTGPTAKNDSTTATPGQKVTIHVLNNDVPGSISLNPSTVQIVGTKNPGQPLNVPHQGIWSVDKKTGDISFNPDNNLVGSPDPIQYTVTDKNDIASNKATVKIIYLSGPTAVNDNATGVSGNPVTVNVLQNDKKGSSDIVPSTVQITGTSHAGDPLNIPGQGVWSVNKNNGDITFSPANGFKGSPDTIQYSVKDVNGIESNLARVKVTYLTGPTAVNDSISGTPGQPATVNVLKNDVKGSSNLDPSTVQILGTSKPAQSLKVTGQGLWSVNKNNGDITFTPDNGFTASPDPIQYYVKDVNGIESNLASVKVNYLKGPIAVDDQAMTEVNHPVTIQVLANDTAGSAPLDPSTLELVSGTQPNPSTVGTFTVDGSNSKITFTPANNFEGTAKVQYRIFDKNNLSDTATVTVNVVQGTVNYYPASGFGTLAFEDLWPYKGDYDFNDMVVDYQFKVNTNTNNYVESVEGTFILKAFGASFKNGFGFQLSSDINPNDLTVTGSKLKENIITLNSNGTEAGQTIPTIIVFDNAFKLMQSPGGIGVNTTPGEPYVTPDTIRIKILFKANTYTYNQLDIADFNPFIFVNQDRSVEIHLPGYKPTALANKSLLGTGDDASDPATGKYYVTKNNLPWAINIYSTFNYPDEKVPIIEAFLKFSAWAKSGGKEYQDWYKNISGYRNNGNIYVVPNP